MSICDIIVESVLRIYLKSGLLSGSGIKQSYKVFDKWGEYPFFMRVCSIVKLNPSFNGSSIPQSWQITRPTAYTSALCENFLLSRYSGER
jgi:hypothetical protein